MSQGQAAGLSSAAMPLEAEGAAGTAALAASSSIFRGRLSSPLRASSPTVLQRFGVWNAQWKGYHLAVDLDARVGDEVLAPADGTVVDVKQVGGYGSDGAVAGEQRAREGWAILIQTAWGVALVGHVEPSVTRGQRVGRGQPIGKVADYLHVVGGRVAAHWPHLHFGLRAGSYDNSNAFVTGYASSTGSWRDPLTHFESSPPEVVFLPPTGVQVGREVSCVAELSDPDGDRVELRVTWGDGTADSVSPLAGARSQMARHTYTRSGQFTGTWTARDEHGGQREGTFRVEVGAPSLLPPRRRKQRSFWSRWFR